MTHTTCTKLVGQFNFRSVIPGISDVQVCLCAVSVSVCLSAYRDSWPASNQV